MMSGYDPASQTSHDTYDRLLPPGSRPPRSPNSSSAFVAAGIDLSGMGSVANNTTFAVTLISPRHVLGANHVGFGDGTVRFVNAAGQVKTYTVTSTTRLTTPGETLPSDLLLGTLSAAIPAGDGIRHFGVTRASAAQAVGLPTLPYGQNPAYATSPHIGTNVIDGVGTHLVRRHDDPDPDAGDGLRLDDRRPGRDVPDQRRLWRSGIRPGTKATWRWSASITG